VKSLRVILNKWQIEILFLSLMFTPSAGDCIPHTVCYDIVNVGKMRIRRICRESFTVPEWAITT